MAGIPRCSVVKQLMQRRALTVKIRTKLLDETEVDSDWNQPSLVSYRSLCIVDSKSNVLAIANACRSTYRAIVRKCSSPGEGSLVQQVCM